MNKVKTALLALAMIVGVVAFAAPAYVGASPASEIQKGVNSTTDDPAASKNLNGVIKTVVNVMLFLLGSLAVIMIIVGGIRYTTSAGNAAQIKAAKDTLMYSIIGLIVALLAYAIVNFVIKSLS